MYGEDDDFIQDDEDEEAEEGAEVISFPHLAQAAEESSSAGTPPPPRPGSDGGDGSTTAPAATTTPATGDRGPDIVQVQRNQLASAPPTGREAAAGIVTGTVMVLSSIWLGRRLELGGEGA